MINRPKPLIPRAVHSRTGTVVVLRIPVGTPREVAEKAKENAKQLAASKPKGEKKTRKESKVGTYQTSLF